MGRCPQGTRHGVIRLTRRDEKPRLIHFRCSESDHRLVSWYSCPQEPTPDETFDIVVTNVGIDMIFDKNNRFRFLSDFEESSPQKSQLAVIQRSVNHAAVVRR